MNLVAWNLINNGSIEPSGGVYAWYYDVKLSDYDIKKTITSIESKELSDRDKRKLASKFLNDHFFHFFREQNYTAKISGKLMPTFEGNLDHVDQISNDLISKLLEKPKLLWNIKTTLEPLTIDFSTPIYIGMTENLSQRVNKHKQLIERFKVEQIHSDNFEDRDENFAARVVARGMNETRLRVAIQYVGSEDGIHNIVENLLNRINYPILGRN